MIASPYRLVVVGKRELIFSVRIARKPWIWFLIFWTQKVHDKMNLANNKAPWHPGIFGTF